MATKLIVKFRDDLYLPFYPALYKMLKVPAGYEGELKQFLAQRNQLSGTEAGLKTRLIDLTEWLKQVNKKLGKPTYLFNYTPLPFFNQFQQLLLKKQEIQRQPTQRLYQMPTFYLCFAYLLPDELPKEDLAHLLDGFGSFLPKSLEISFQNPPVYGWFEKDPSLLDYAYAYDGVEATQNTTPPSPPLPGNQKYADYMQLHRLAGINGENDWIGIVENSKWNTRHTEFEEARARIQLANTPPNSPYRPTYLSDGTNFARHGTKTLGILVADANSPCQGIVPKTNIVLASTQIDRGSVENAITLIQNFYLQRGLDHQVMLIEVATSVSQLPITILPVVFDLVESASQVGHIVVISAGNNGRFELKNTATNRQKIRSVLRDSNVSCWQPRCRNDELIFRTTVPYLLVGAVWENKTTDGYFQVYSDTNWGRATVPVYAQGESVLTTSHEHTPPNQYTTMGQTSASAAIIAGVVILLQNYAQQKLGRALTPTEIKTAISLGTPVYKGTRRTDNPSCGVVPSIELAMRLIDTLAAVET